MTEKSTHTPLKTEHIETVSKIKTANNIVKNKIYQDLLNKKVRSDQLHTSTPVLNKGCVDMDSFKKLYEEGKYNFQVLVDNDSGYVSHHQESTFDSSSENMSEVSTNHGIEKPVYLSEDALLEKPEISTSKFDLSAEIDRENYEEASRLFNSSCTDFEEASFKVSNNLSCSFDVDKTHCEDEPSKFFTSNETIISNSYLSERTEFSGLESEISHNSDIIPIADDIVAPIDCSVNHEEVKSEQCDNVGSKSSIKEITEADSTSANEVTSAKTGLKLFSFNTVITSVEKREEIVPEAKTKSCAAKVFKQPDYSYISPLKRTSTAKKYVPSPDLFSDCEEEQPHKEEPVIKKTTFIEQYAQKCDQKLLKQVQNGMTGVLPPPSVTMVNMSVDEMLNRLKENKEYFWTSENSKSFSEADCSSSNLNVSVEAGQRKSSLINSTFGSVYKSFPEILKCRYHGLHHNRSKLSEEFEHLCDKYAQRYVGMETQSTCTVFEISYASPKKRINRQRWTAKSPGRRLSHLARRRITFSSSNLQAVNNSFVGSRTRQIMIDAKKLELLSRKKSPRKTPKKSPARSPIKTRTPSSSAKKKLAMRFRMVTGEIEDSCSNTSSVKSERSLFYDDSSRESGLMLPSVGDTKRRLFSLSNSSDILNKKRKRSDNEENQLVKLARLDMKPTKSEMKSVLSSLNRNDTLTRSSQSCDTTELYKKKLQWAVYEALRSQNIPSDHAEFKTFANTLARVIRRFLPNLSVARPEGGFSERMLRLARHHVYAVTKGRTVDEIVTDYIKAKERQQNSQNSFRSSQQISQSSFRSSQQSSQSSFRSSQGSSSSRCLSDFKSVGESSNSNKENIFRSRSPRGSSRGSSFVFKDKNECDNRINRIRKVINFGEDNR